MTGGDVQFLARLCEARAGLQPEAVRGYLVESRLAPVARREGYATVEELVAAVRVAANERLGWAVVEAVVSGECMFFRDPAAFEVMAEHVNGVANRIGASGPVRVWSAGCGAGQEAYSLAMRLRDLAPFQLELVATDINSRALEKARSGIYTQFEVQSGLPAKRLVRHFEKQGDAFVVDDTLRRAIVWRRANLMDDLSALGQFDLILCSRVFGGLTEAARTVVAAEVSRRLAPGGILVIDRQDDARALAHGFAQAPGLSGAQPQGGARVFTPAERAQIAA